MGSTYFRHMRSIALIMVLLTALSMLAQEWNWAVDAGGGGNTDFCYGIATDSQGNAYWVGTVSGTADFGCATLTPGSTIAGVDALEQRGFRGSCIAAVDAAFEKTRQLG